MAENQNQSNCTFGQYGPRIGVRGLGKSNCEANIQLIYQHKRKRIEYIIVVSRLGLMRASN
jgi:hypothetical protein